MPDSKDIRELIDKYAKAVSKKDVDAILALFADGAIQTDPASAPSNVGKDAIRTFFDGMVQMSTSIQFVPTAMHASGDNVAIDFRITVTIAGPDGQPSTMVIEGIEVFTVSEDCLITSVTAYFDDTDVTAGAGPLDLS